MLVTPRQNRKPEWLKIRPPRGENYNRLKGLTRDLKLHTVCEEAQCPNVSECWGGGTATLMLLGDTCTRGCRFCHVKTGNPRGFVDLEEPQKVAEAVREMGLNYVVLTSVDRDDLPDGGADHFARCVEAIKAQSPKTLVEVLVPDFSANRAAIERLVESHPEVIAQNVETVERLTRKVRDPRCGYQQSLQVLATVKELDHRIFTKSSIMVGLGEQRDEVIQCMKDLLNVGVSIVTLGQYLRPSSRQLPVEEYVRPEVFKQYEQIGLEMGFMYVASGPLVRSSYKAGEHFIEGLIRNRTTQQGSLHPQGANEWKLTQ